MISNIVKGLMILVLVTPVVSSQSAPPEASASEKKKARDEREKKVLALVDELTKELQSIQLPENRIRLSLDLAEAVWSRDEKRARALFKDAVTSLTEIRTAIDNADPEYQHQDQLIQQLRQEMVQLAGKHDARLAIDFLRATRPDIKSAPPNSGITNLEAQIEMRLAIQIANRDPNEALAVAEDSLKIALDYEALNLLSALQSKQKAAAERFLEGILNAIRTNWHR
jgi:TolA-binding protein